MPDVDVIVLDLDGGAMLAECVASLGAQSLPPARIIVFDNGSRVPSRVEGAEVIRSDRNLGFAGGNNAAYATTTAPYVALVNNDVVLDGEWLRTLVDELERDAKLAAVQTIIRRDSATIDGAGIDVSDGTFRQIGHGAPLDARLPEAWGVSATAAVYRRAALGGRLFDETLFAYYEDVELCARFHADGWSLRVVPRALATHRGSQSSSRVNARYLRTRNRYRVARKHRGVGRIAALLFEDARLLPRGQSSLRGIVAGLFG